MSTFKVKVPDGALEHLLSSSSASWIPSKSRLLQFPGRDDLLEELLRRLLTKATKLAGEPLIPLKCVLCRYDDNQGSCELHLGTDALVPANIIRQGLCSFELIA